MTKHPIVWITVAFLFITGLHMISTHNPSSVSTAHLTRNDIVLAAGDSLTYGYGANETESYPSVLSRLGGFRVVNAGKNGETSEEGLRRLPDLLKRYRPKVTVLCYGGNDLLQKKSTQTLQRNLIAMIELARRYGSDVLLVSVPSLTLFGLEPLEIYRDVARETEVALLEGVLSDILENPDLKSDQIHPNAKGYRIFAEAIYEKMRTEGWIP